MVFVFVVVEFSMPEWRCVGHEWDVCLGKCLVGWIHIVIWGETRRCILWDRTGRQLSEHQCMRSSMPGGVGGDADNAGDDREYKGEGVL